MCRANLYGDGDTAMTVNWFHRGVLERILQN